MSRTVNYAGTQQVYDKEQVDSLINNVAGNVGDLESLSTTDKSTIVDAINEVNAKANTNTTNISNNTSAISSQETRIQEAINKVGDLSLLSTENKESAVAAINEVKGSLEGAVSGEAIARQEAIDTVTDNLATEVEAREDADTALSARIDTNESGLSTEANLRSSTDNELAARIDLEIENRVNAIRTVSSDVNTEINARINADADLGARMTGCIAAIEEKIPNQASASNQLADKAFVNSSVQTETANFRGNWNTWDDVPIEASAYPEDFVGNRKPTLNDYIVVKSYNSEGTWRFKYSGKWEEVGKSGWQPEYQVNNTVFTAEQLAAINSGITAALVAKITELEQQVNKCHPVGYVYTQWPGESSPVELGLKGTWTDISDTKAGLFIRVAGGDAAAFGTIQAEGLPNITGELNNIRCRSANANGSFSITALYKTQTDASSSTDERGCSIDFDASKSNAIYGGSDHVTPVNTAIRVWKRTV